MSVNLDSGPWPPTASATAAVTKRPSTAQPRTPRVSPLPKSVMRAASTLHDHRIQNSRSFSDFGEA
jgi:hypothetical protein